MASGPVNPEQMTEEQLRVAYEREIKRVRVDQVVLENVVTIVNLGLRRSGLMPGAEDERDLGQVQLAIEVVRALLPQIERIAPDQLEPIRQALSQLQLAFVQAGGGASASQAGGGQGGAAATGPTAPVPDQEPATPNPEEPGEPGPAQKSGRLWIPGQ